MSTRVRSFSKINLGLAVGPPRPAGTKDAGFHALTTLYQTLALHDLVTVTARPAPQTSITLTADHPGVPSTERGDAENNTAFRILDLALRHLNLTAEVHIDIQKRLPVQGGLGAGSANAAAALIGLERELAQPPWALSPGPAAPGELARWGGAPWTLPGPARLALAAEVGSDVPLFLLGGSVLGLGRGEEVYPFPDLPLTPCVLAIPSVGVSTAAAFRALDARDLTAQNTASPSEPRHLDRRPQAGAERPLYFAAPVPSQTLPLTAAPIPDRLEQLSRALSAAWSPSGVNLALGGNLESAKEPSPSGIARRSSDLAENPLLALVRTGIENDFEEVVFQEHPSLRSTKRDLVGNSSVPEGSRAIYAALSGSGSALFGLYRSMADARSAQQRVQASGTQALLTETLPRSDYWRTMLEF
jgi:4-diphosphocytidyl-2-C-methyl-D-erythritol kinase